MTVSRPTLAQTRYWLLHTDEREKALDRHERLVVELTIEAVREHMACACNSIEGHLRTRGLTLRNATHDLSRS